MEKISANRDTRFRVKPQAQEANSVSASVTAMATPTMTASRRPSANTTSSTTTAVANTSFWIRVSAFSLAVSP